MDGTIASWKISAQEKETQVVLREGLTYQCCLRQGWLQAGHDFYWNQKANFIFFVNYKWLLEYSSESCIFCLFMKQRTWAEVTGPLDEEDSSSFLPPPASNWAIWTDKKNNNSTNI